MLAQIEFNIIKEFESDFDKYFQSIDIYNLYQKIKSGNYNITDIYSCLEILNFDLYIGNVKAITREKFGDILRTNRKSLNKTRLNLTTENKISFTIINKIESGKNCRKNNLNKYLEAFPDLNIQIIKR